MDFSQTLHYVFRDLHHTIGDIEDEIKALDDMRDDASIAEDTISSILSDLESSDEDNPFNPTDYKADLEHVRYSLQGHDNDFSYALENVAEAIDNLIDSID